LFFITYLRRELRRRMRQAIVIALGLAVGIGLVITVSAAAAGVRNAESGVLKGLYGVGTDVTVTAKPERFNPGKGGTRIQIGPSGGRVCHGTTCKTGAQTIDNLTSQAYGPLADSTINSVAKLKDVASVAGGLTLSDTQIKIPGSIGSGAPGTLPQPKTFAVDGVDLSRPNLGPLSAGKITSGRNLASSDASSSVAVVDADYAASHSLKVGDTITIAKKAFKIVGLVRQPQSGSPPDVYIPLARAQALAQGFGSKKNMDGQVNTIYVAATSASAIPAVQREISRLLPKATVTTSASLASQVTGSLTSADRLANDLGRWLSVLVLIAAFAVACLLTMSAVARRVREFGTLKALGWRSRRIVAQVLGESVTTGIIGGAVGVGLGVAGAAIITKIAPELTATLTSPTGQHFFAAGPAGSTSDNPTTSHTVPVPLHASVTAEVILLAVVLAVVGGLLAGAFGSWRISQLRPAAALARVE
jgi:putative ABC transport system permease protein